jgi:hypothetical protein
MLPRDRAEKILTLSQAGWSVRAIADHLGHSPYTIRGYLNGRTTPGVRAPRPSLLTDLLADYCRQRFVEDPHLRPNALFHEVTELGFPASRATFYRELRRYQLPPARHRQPPTQQTTTQEVGGISRPFVDTPEHGPVLPRPLTPITGEVLVSYLTRLAHANHLTLAEVLAALPAWVATKINNRDDRAQHRTLVPTAEHALRALAHLTNTTPTGLAHALPAFGLTSTNDDPLRATTACHRCTARRGIRESVPVHLPVHDKVCTHHGIWLSDVDQPHLDVAACPEIITAQHRAHRLLRRYTPRQLTLAHQAATRAVPVWPTSANAIPLHWRHRLLTLQTTNHRRGVPTDNETYRHAAIYPDAVTLAAAILNVNSTRTQPQDP